VSANVSEEFPNRLRVVAMNDLAKPLFFLGFEEESGHLGFVHFGTSGGSGHVDDHTGWRLERCFASWSPDTLIDAAG
jgi:hypothetical protein